MFEKSCKAKDMWFDNMRWEFPNVEARHITKYFKEISIGKESLKKENNETFNITPLYPLLTFPKQENAHYQKFIKRISKTKLEEQ